MPLLFISNLEVRMDRFEILRQRLARDCPALEVRVGEPMSRHTSFHIGGPAALMALPKTREEAQAALAAAGALGIEPFFLGNGSNLLVPDGGAERFFIKNLFAAVFFIGSQLI